MFSADPGSDLYIASNQGDELRAGVVAFASNGVGDSYVFPVEDGVAQDRVSS